VELVGDLGGLAATPLTPASRIAVEEGAATRPPASRAIGAAAVGAVDGPAQVPAAPPPAPVSSVIGTPGAAQRLIPAPTAAPVASEEGEFLAEEDLEEFLPPPLPALGKNGRRRASVSSVPPLGFALRLPGTSEPNIARTIFLTVVGTAAVGATVGLLFWWLGGGNAPPSASTSRPALRASLPNSDAPAELAPGRAASTELFDRARRALHASDSTSSKASATPVPAAVSVPVTASAPVSASDPESVPSSSPDSASAVASEEPIPAGDSERSGAAPPVRDAERGRAESAKGSYQRAFEAAKRSLRHRNHQEALGHAERALTIKETAAALTIKADALLGLGERRRALAALETAIIVAPRYAPAWDFKGYALRGLGKKQEAREAFARYLELEPDGRKAAEVSGVLEKL
jgi:hypothetical protein